jgi:8-oxo-dGTP pyrophosphatase MutT (NUDIX family)
VPPAEPGGAFRKIEDQVRYSGWAIQLVSTTFEAPDGTSFTRDVIRHPGAVAVVPVTDHDTVLLVSQYRGPIERELLELPAGTLDVPGEAPETAARRELAEEVGFEADRLRPLASILNAPGYSDQVTHLYVADGLHPCPTDRHGVEESQMTVVERTWAQIDAMIAEGTLVDAHTLVGLLLARPLVTDRPSGDR